MSKKRLAFTLLYTVIAAIEIFSAVNEKIGWVYVFKPALLVALLLWSVLSPDLRIIKAKKIFLAGMVFACMGDIFLMLPNEYFMAGLGCFLVMQWLYTYVFVQERDESLTLSFYLGTLAPILFLLIGLNYVVLSAISDDALAFAVILYAVSIATMALFAFLRKRKGFEMSHTKVACGAMLFLISDALLAMDRFVAPIPESTIWVMSTYAAAQYLIVVGMQRNTAAFSLK
jgi:uncharacterized membrane protein YhhN